jgi:hypothetical protein
MKEQEYKLLPCLRCDHKFKTTIENRICHKCKLTYDNTFEVGLEFGSKEGKPYGDMGIWEKK